MTVFSRQSTVFSRSRQSQSTVGSPSRQSESSVGLRPTAAFVLARGLQSLLYGVGAADPVSYAGAAAVMAMSVVLACALPAWRAARVDPTVALRRDGIGTVVGRQSVIVSRSR